MVFRLSVQWSLVAALALGLGACVSGAPTSCTQCGSACVDVRTDSDNCGACGTVCAAGSVCRQGGCVATCAASLLACGGSCVDPKNDPSHCGACDTACGANEVCAQGTCGSACPSTTTVCTGSAGLVCADLQRDAAHCGACGVACAAGQACSGGHCTADCAADQSRCGGEDGGAGFCASLQSDNAHCGDCGTACGAGLTCTSGHCVPGCVSGTQACVGASGTFCADLQSDNAHCGDCATVCGAGLSCTAGHCVPGCVGGTTACSDVSGTFCAALATDSAHCGSCTTVCPQGQVCSNGACAVQCAGSTTACGAATDGGFCTDTASDARNCGACGVACAATEFCLAGACQVLPVADCAELKSLHPDAGDGAYTLSFGHQWFRRYAAQCKGASTYLPLDAGANVSMYNNHAWGLSHTNNPNLVTTWSAVRMDQSGQVTLDDYSFSTSTGSVGGQGTGLHLAFGTTGDCAAGNSATGLSTIDLTSTPFAVDPVATTWHISGYYPGGTATLSAANQKVSLTGGGFCGGNGPSLPDGGVAIQLKYVGFTCKTIHALNPAGVSGVYSLVDGSGPGATLAPLAYCDMATASAGWTLALKADGTRSDSAFFYDSPYWTTDATLNDRAPDLSAQESKYSAFMSVPFTEVRLDQGGRTVVAAAASAQSSLLDVMLTGRVALTTTSGAWATTFGPVQANCQQLGLNNLGSPAAVRIGLLGNNEADCSSPDSYAGVGGNLAVDNCYLSDGGTTGTSSGSLGGGTCAPGGVNTAGFSLVWVR